MMILHEFAETKTTIFKVSSDRDKNSESLKLKPDTETGIGKTFPTHRKPNTTDSSNMIHICFKTIQFL